ncbi:MAG: hypothetical protein IH964_04365 [Candidatus Dadabacteria bacterium]|nr:hypothetical protein [Candidatus Dadabacteria bacterium]
MALPKVDLDLINEASKELEGESDRAAAIVGASLLENLLESIFRKAMIDHKEVKNILKPYGPLGTFKAKIDLSFLLGLFPHAKIYQDLNNIREIRNYFAHGHKELSFAHNSIRNRIFSLNILSLYRSTLELYQEHENELDEKQKAFYEKAKGPRRMWEVAIYSISTLLSNYEGFTVKPTLEGKRKVKIAGIEADC